MGFAAEAAGLSRQTVHEWLAKGAEGIDPYADFYKRYRKAVGQFVDKTYEMSADTLYFRWKSIEQHPELRKHFAPVLIGEEEKRRLIREELVKLAARARRNRELTGDAGSPALIEAGEDDSGGAAGDERTDPPAEPGTEEEPEEV